VLSPRPDPATSLHTLCANLATTLVTTACNIRGEKTAIPLLLVQPQYSLTRAGLVEAEPFLLPMFLHAVVTKVVARFGGRPRQRIGNAIGQSR
jgi:hypothetical protein